MAQPAEPQRPLFTTRYGINDRNPDAELWQRRHLAAAEDERTALHCICPGGATDKARNPCRQRCTQEDMLCDECRRWCYAVDLADSRHPFVELYGAAH
jgi:hypothetical protein